MNYNSGQQLIVVMQLEIFVFSKRKNSRAQVGVRCIMYHKQDYTGLLTNESNY